MNDTVPLVKVLSNTTDPGGDVRQLEIHFSILGRNQRPRIAEVSKHQCSSLKESCDYAGAGSRIRTDDLLITNQLL